jgi:hypothetical protein
MENNMPKVMIQIDGQVIEADAEQVQYLADWKSDIAADKAAREADLTAEATAKSALLDRLGITADEAKLLLS